MKNTEPFQTDNLDTLSKYGFNNVVAAIGVFDGIHLGHRKLIKTLLDMAGSLSAGPIIITFFPHPRKVLMHDEHLRFLRNPDEKLKIMEELGIKAVVTIPFTAEFASLPPQKFIEHFMLPHNVKLKGICVGSKWQFGQKASGNSDTLHKFADEYNFKFSDVSELYKNNQLVSSTAIRKALKEGDFNTANFMLDCIYSITGKVYQIKKTAPESNTVLNVFVEYGILPPKGEYTIYIRHNSQKVKTYAKVNSEDSIEIIYPSNDFRENFLKFEFISKI
jgi:riboflavin kinase / FMN adenylyltransferase